MPGKATAWRDLVAPTDHPAQAHQVESLDAVAAGHALQNDRPAQAAEPANIKPLPIGSHALQNDSTARAGGTDRPARAHQVESLCS